MKALRNVLIAFTALTAVPALVPSAGATTTTRAMSVSQLTRLAKCESSGRPEAVSKNGKYHGLYQFDQTTWNGVAVRAGRPDLVGLRPSRVHFLNQILLAQQLYKERGPQPWPVCRRVL